MKIVNVIALNHGFLGESFIKWSNVMNRKYKLTGFLNYYRSEVASQLRCENFAVLISLDMVLYVFILALSLMFHPK